MNRAKMNISNDEMKIIGPMVDKNATLMEITYKARDKVVNERIKKMEKHMDSLAILVQKLREGHMRFNERNFVRSADVPESSNNRHV